MLQNFSSRPLAGSIFYSNIHFVHPPAVTSYLYLSATSLRTSLRDNAKGCSETIGGRWYGKDKMSAGENFFSFIKHKGASGRLTTD